MLLRSALRTVARRWILASAVGGTVFLIGLCLAPRAFTYTARARLILLPDRWTPNRALDFALSPAVLEEAARALGSVGAPDLQGSLRIRPESGSLELEGVGGTPGRAMGRVNEVGRAFGSLSAAARHRENAATLKRLEETLAERRRAPSGTAGPGDSPAELARGDRRRALERSLEDERLQITEMTARMGVLGGLIDRNEGWPARPVNTSESDRITAELDQERRQLEELRATYPDDWPPVTRAASRVQELATRRAIAANREILEARFAPMREAIEELRGLSGRKDALQREAAVHEAELGALEVRGGAQPPAASPDPGVPLQARREAMASLAHEVEAARTRLALEQAGGNAVVERFEPALSARCSGSALPLLLGIALVLGLASAWGAESLATTLRTEQDIRRYVNLPLLAIIPHEPEPLRRHLPASGPGITEAFNSLAALIETRTKEDGSRLFAVTSAAPSEGKSTVASNVAVALARAGSRVLLVDADLRRGSQHRIFSVSEEPGLSAYLQGGTDTIDSMMSATDVDNLTLMPAGSPMQNPIPFLHAERFHALLRDLRGWYEYVIVDLPPVRHAADPLIVSPLADAVILVTAAGETRKDDVTYAKRMIRSVKAKVCGCVLMKARVRVGGYYYYSTAVAADASE